MFTSLRIYPVFKCPDRERRPQRAHSGQGAASVIPFLRAERDSRFTDLPDEGARPAPFRHHRAGSLPSS